MSDTNSKQIYADKAALAAGTDAETKVVPLGKGSVLIGELSGLDLQNARNWAKKYVKDHPEEGLDEAFVTSCAASALAIVQPPLEIDDAVWVMSLPAQRQLRLNMEVAAFNGLGGKEVQAKLADLFRGASDDDARLPADGEAGVPEAQDNAEGTES